MHAGDPCVAVPECGSMCNEGTDSCGPFCNPDCGGGPRKSDCYVVFWRTPKDCRDGDAACDLDGSVDGACTFRVTVCAYSTSGCGGCTPKPVKRIRVTPKKVRLKLPPLPASETVCGEPNLVRVPLKRAGKKPGKLKLGIVATVEGKPRRDKDTLVLRCSPGTS